jgi:hypothetical protein
MEQTATDIKLPNIDFAALDTEIEIAFTEEVESYIRNLPWSETTADETKTLVAGNIRAYARRERITGPLNGFITKLAERLSALGKENATLLTENAELKAKLAEAEKVIAAFAQYDGTALFAGVQHQFIDMAKNYLKERNT